MVIIRVKSGKVKGFWKLSGEREEKAEAGMVRAPVQNGVPARSQTRLFPPLVRAAIARPRSLWVRSYVFASGL